MEGWKVGMREAWSVWSSVWCVRCEMWWCCAVLAMPLSRSLFSRPNQQNSLCIQHDTAPAQRNHPGKQASTHNPIQSLFSLFFLSFSLSSLSFSSTIRRYLVAQKGYQENTPNPQCAARPTFVQPASPRASPRARGGWLGGWGRVAGTRPISARGSPEGLAVKLGAAANLGLGVLMMMCEKQVYGLG